MRRDARLHVALALVVAVAVIAVPILIWARNKKKPPTAEGAEASASISASATPSDSSSSAVSFGDAGASAAAIDAGGRALTFGEPRYLRCQDPGPGKTPPDKCDHLGAIEELATKAIAANITSCLTPQNTVVSLAVDLDVNFKRKKVGLSFGKDGTTLPAAQRKKAASCFHHALGAPSWDGVGHAHQRYLLQIPVTLQPSLGQTVPGGPAVPAAANP